MASADYYHCDVCGCRAFYDAGLNYDFDVSVEYGCGSKLGFVGDMACICDECAKTHRVEVVLRPTPPSQPSGPAQQEGKS